METREFPVAVLYSLATGRSFCPFAAIHEAIEYVLGSSIWTHHLAIPEPWEAVRRAVTSQYPALASYEAGDAPEEGREEWAMRHLANVEAIVGRETLPLQPLPEGAWRPKSPFEDVPEGVPTLFVEVDPK